MIYKHRYFKLDTESKRVFDENSKELALTGNAYRLLAYLCDKKNSSITDINDHFDPTGAKEYTENHIRQYRYKINSIVGHSVIAYKNYTYSIDGTVLKSEPGGTSESAVPKPSEAVKSPVGETSDESARQTPRWWRKKLSLQEKLAIPFLIMILAIFSATVFRNRGKNPGATAKSNLPNETAAMGGLRPQDDMILIPAGDFLMGSTEQQALVAWRQNDGGWEKEDYLSEYPQQKIMLNDFYIDKKEVSNDDYKMFVGATKRAAPSLWGDQTLNLPNQPVVEVDWNDADAYCLWLGKRLPTEAEWEKAARGTDGRIWPWGNVWDPTKDNHGKGTGYGFDESDGYQFTAPVGIELGASPYEVLNMAGNVYEWVSDDFNSFPGNDKYTQTDFNKGFKVLKGGAYTDGISEQRPASRCGYQKDYKDVDVGFRCSRDK